MSTENGDGARRLAIKAAALAPDSAEAYRTLAQAHRLNFDLESSAEAYAKAVELDPASDDARRGLADMTRALGKFDEAAALYREMLGQNAENVPARTGLVLSLFDSGKQADAEAEMAKAAGNDAFEHYPDGRCGVLVRGQRASGQGGRAGVKSRRYRSAIYLDAPRPRTRPDGKGAACGSRRSSLRARQYGRFPTLDYEIASRGCEPDFIAKPSRNCGTISLWKTVWCGHGSADRSTKRCEH